MLRNIVAGKAAVGPLSKGNLKGLIALIVK